MVVNISLAVGCLAYEDDPKNSPYLRVPLFLNQEGRPAVTGLAQGANSYRIAKMLGHRQKYGNNQTREMIGLLTKVKIVDNSGAIEGRCIKVYGKKDKAYIGDTILLSITNLAKGRQNTIKRGEKYKAMIVRMKKGEGKVVPGQPFLTR